MQVYHPRSLHRAPLGGRRGYVENGRYAARPRATPTRTDGARTDVPRATVYNRATCYSPMLQSQYIPACGDSSMRRLTYCHMPQHVMRAPIGPLVPSLLRLRKHFLRRVGTGDRCSFLILNLIVTPRLCVGQRGITLIRSQD